MNRVKEFRIARGWSQMTLAKEIDVARQTINLIENNKYNPSLDLCIKLAKALQTDLNALFWEVEELNQKDIKENGNEKNR
ncbi:helix-turn-helix transcriptional regulator [Aerococcaceae bacterium NML210727]|nr:helix-turn-helix transcriptional regulator [Aerococcaceae bacterium NML210727]MCW6655123.1 helix-turn-helix transcriptional regulator [Aerococcaceae bacterium NML201296]MCW6663755.1 helix-turn-helix transcriptional regulator [Aerococcaceae bacterium NML190073]MCW6665546.1 helix-turn-helix transcriptional regulator [Aerococcaceae bacterium NML191219]